MTKLREECGVFGIFDAEEASVLTTLGLHSLQHRGQEGAGIVSYDGKKFHIFGEGGVKKTAEEFKKDFLCEIPLDPEVGKQGDKGIPIVESYPDNDVSKIYLELASKIKSIYLLN